MGGGTMSKAEPTPEEIIDNQAAEIADLQDRLALVDRQNHHYRALLLELHDAVGRLFDFADMTTSEIWDL
jgi:hypothetical protein